jgi:hypothetical protein
MDTGGRPAGRGAWKYSDAMAVGMGGECVRLMCDGLVRQPAALKPGVFRKASLMVMRRSPTPSLMVFR